MDLVEFNRRFMPVFRAMAKIIHNDENHAYLAVPPERYEGWVDFFDGEENYCTIFDQNEEKGRILGKGLKDSLEGTIVDWEIAPNVRVQGTVRGQGNDNNLDWYVIQTF